MNRIIIFINCVTSLFPGADLILLHFPAGFIFGMIGRVYGGPWEPLRLSAEAGAFKEVYDFGKGSKNILKGIIEFLFTFLGGVVAWLL